jgi:D-alanine-D-alanine ligase
MDEWATKLVAEAVGVRTAPRRLAAAAETADIGFETEVVKPASTGSSFGVAQARDAAQLRDALRCAARFDDRILIEDVVPGREIDVAVLREADGGRWASPPLEIHTDGLFDTQAKYDGSARFGVPADVDGADRAALTGSALRMFDALGCAGVARIDSSSPMTGPSSTRSTPCRG